MNRLIEAVSTGRLALGSQVFDADTVEMLAYCGIDYVWADLMFGSLDWSDAREIARMCQATGVACLIRAKTVPWIQSVDKAAIADCQRILTLNATGAIMSVSTVEEVKLLVEASKDWHRGLHFHPFTKDTFAEYKATVIASTFSIPLIEEADLFRDIDQVLAVDGLKAVWLAMSDLSRTLGHPFDYEHPEVWAAVHRTVALAKKRGIVVAANIGWDSPSIEAQVKRALDLWGNGIGMVSIQNIVQPIYQQIIQATKIGSTTR